MAQHMRDVAASPDLTVRQKLALVERHREELDRRVQLIEALLDSVRRLETEAERP